MMMAVSRAARGQSINEARIRWICDQIGINDPSRIERGNWYRLADGTVIYFESRNLAKSSGIYWLGFTTQTKERIEKSPKFFYVLFIDGDTRALIVPRESIKGCLEGGRPAVKDGRTHVTVKEDSGDGSIKAQATEGKDWFDWTPFLKPVALGQLPTEQSDLPPRTPNEAKVTVGASQPIYSLENVFDDGCFLSRKELEDILQRWRSKKNIILQGPPGTGKTWLAKRLGFVLLGSKDRARLRVVQFHPSLNYEDFVRGYRPSAEGKLELQDGILLQAIEAARSKPDRPFVLVIEEINRGNPAQIFGEMLTLLENTKRAPSEAIELAYRKLADERIYIPANLFVIGTMNVADRSLALVDLALRRRFAFVDLRPRLGPAWRSWCLSRGLDDGLLAEIESRLEALNGSIAGDKSLGPQFQIGHSYVTPDGDGRIDDGPAWFRAKVESEIGPLLDEYWYDSPETARKEISKLLAGLS